MDFELEQSTILCYEQVGQAVVRQEETQEAIVPDACPDVLRIADVCAQILCESCRARDGQADIRGSVRACVLCIPEGGGEVFRLELKLPFEMRCDLPEITTDCLLKTGACLQSVDGRILNPRKLLLRADLAVEITALRSCSPVVTTNARQDEGGTLCRRRVCVEFERMSAAVQRTVPLSGEIRLTGTQAPTLLCWSCAPLCTESRMIGSKLIFKGKADVALLLQTGEGAFERRTESFPFSQIMEARGVGEGGQTLVDLSLTALQCIQLPDDPFRVMVEGEMEAFGQVWDREELSVLTDLYSTADELLLDHEPLVLCAPGESLVVPQTLRELLETQEVVRSICSARFEPGLMKQSRQDDELTVTMPGRIVVLFLDEGRQLRRLEKQVEITLHQSVPKGGQIFCRGVVPGELYAAPCAGGVEVRLELEFQLYCSRELGLQFVNRAERGQPRGGDGPRPSVILRRPEAGEELWDIAKSCGTTVERIAGANELTPEDTPPQRMLLIPSAR